MRMLSFQGRSSRAVVAAHLATFLFALFAGMFLIGAYGARLFYVDGLTEADIAARTAPYVWALGLGGIIWLAALVAPALVRRLHDIGWSGWWLPLVVLPLAPLALMIVWRGAAGDNRFGAQPCFSALPIYFILASIILAIALPLAVMR